MNKTKVFLITGGAGFIGINLVRLILDTTPHQVINVDLLTYAANTDALNAFACNANYQFACADIADQEEMAQLIQRYQPDVILHLAAESHVDRSIAAAADFMRTNIMGTYSLLSASLAYWQSLPANRQAEFVFHHVSTDEVFGDLPIDAPAFVESDPYQPSSPYAASKASSDHLVRAWHRTYQLPVLLSHCSNNFGPYQHNEKLIPLVIDKLLNQQSIPIYGNGLQQRDWLYVTDHAKALLKVALEGKRGDSYNIGTGQNCTNLALVRRLCALFDQRFPAVAKQLNGHQSLIQFVPDPAGHDVRYAINSHKIQTTLGWQPEVSFELGLQKTLDWYIDFYTIKQHQA